MKPRIKTEFKKYTTNELAEAFERYLKSDHFDNWIGLSFWIHKIEPFNPIGKYCFDRNQLYNELIRLVRIEENIFRVLYSDYMCERIRLIADKQRLVGTLDMIDKDKVKILAINGEEITYIIGVAKHITFLEQDQEGDWYFIDFKSRVQYLDNNSNLLFIQ